MSLLELFFGFGIILWLSIFFLVVSIEMSTVKWPSNHQGTQNNNTEKREVGRTSGTGYNLTMGLHKPKHDKWLTIDDNYLLEHDIKQRLLQNKKNSVVGHTQGAEAACEELLEVVAEYLTTNYPWLFRYCARPGLQVQVCVENVDCVEIISTGEIFRLTAPFTHKTALETAAHLAMEDLNILCKGDNGQHVLIASATCFPVGWSEKLENPVERFLSKITSRTNLERTTRFVQVTDTQTNLADVLCQLAPLKQDKRPEDATQIIIRTERQTFKKLPKTGTILFAVKTSLKTLAEFSAQELKSFRDDVSSWPEDVAGYKGRHCWGECAVQYCDSVLASIA